MWPTWELIYDKFCFIVLISFHLVAVVAGVLVLAAVPRDVAGAFKNEIKDLFPL